MHVLEQRHITMATHIMASMRRRVQCASCLVSHWFGCNLSEKPFQVHITFRNRGYKFLSVCFFSRIRRPLMQKKSNQIAIEFEVFGLSQNLKETPVTGKHYVNSWTQSNTYDCRIRESEANLRKSMREVSLISLKLLKQSIQPLIDSFPLDRVKSAQFFREYNELATNWEEMLLQV